MCRTTFVAWVVVAVLGLLPTGVRAWPVRLATESPVFQAQQSIAVDGAGHVYAYGGAGLVQFLVKLDAGGGSELWRYEPLTHGVPRSRLELDPAGDLVAAGGVAVVKVSGSTGTEMWYHSFTDVSFGALAVDAAGDVYAAGSIIVPPLNGVHYPGIVKYSGIDGTELWRADLFHLGSGAMLDVALDGAGNILAIGTAGVAVGIKLAAATGQEIWSASLDTPPLGLPSRLAVDGAGDLVVNGAEAIAKYAGGDGQVIWHRSKIGIGAWNVVDLALTASGDVLGGAVGNDLFGAIRLSGSDGSTLWLRSIPGAPAVPFAPVELPDGATRVAVDPAGDVIVTGVVDGAFSAAKLAGNDGTPVWVTILRPPVVPSVRPIAVAVDANGDVAAANGPKPAPAPHDVAVVKLSAADGRLVACGDGSMDTGEQCDDGNATAGDGCESDCTKTVCVGGVTLVKPRITIKPMTPPGLAYYKVTVKGDLPFAPGSPASFHPPTNGAQVVVEDLGYAGYFYNLSRQTLPVPGTPAGSCDPLRDVWRTSVSVTKPAYTYRNRSGAIDPPTCTPVPFGSLVSTAQGVTLVKFTDQRASKGLIKFTSQSKFAPLGPGEALRSASGPFRVTVVLGGGDADSTSGACGSYSFSPVECASTGRSFVCKPVS